MPDLIGLAGWPGVNQVLRADFTLSQGISPSVAMLEIVPQIQTISLDGTLQFVFGATRLAFAGCRVDRASFQYTSEGLLWSLAIYDRRWKWQYGQISGTYNVRKKNGDIDSETNKTPQQLCLLCLEAMGERSRDVSQVPNDARPEVHWDRDNPAQALAAICDQVGCRVVLTLSGAVRVVRAGIGPGLPPSGIMQDQAVIDPPERPDSLLVVGGRTRFQIDFVLEAVGKDTDGTIKPIDDLSYKPTAGWANENPLFFLGVSETATSTYQVPRELAKATVWRWYRIKLVDPADTSKKPMIHGWGGRIEELWQILPIESVQVAGWANDDGTFTSAPAFVYGTWWAGRLGFANTDANTPYQSGFSIDQDEGIVQFSDYVFKLDTDNTIAEAALYLRCAVNVKSESDRTVNRYQRSHIFPGIQQGTGPRLLKHEELTAYYVPTYGTNYKVTKLTSNLDRLNRDADYYLTAAALEYTIPTGRDVLYAGLMAIDLDGVTQQVTWQVGPQGATTRASQNTEWNPAIPDYGTRRAVEKQNAADLAKLQDAVRAQQDEGRKR